MAKRPTHTVLFVGIHRTDRVDFGLGPNFALLSQSHKATQLGDDLTIHVETALTSGQKIGKSVWILWEGATTQMLDMPSAVVEGLDRAQLAESLSFEAETLTGLPAGDSAIDGVAQIGAAGVLPESRRFWITQIPTDVRDKLDGVSKRLHTQLAGIVHPGGLPLARWDGKPDAEPNGQWQRIEVWDQLTFSLQGKPDGTVETRVIRFSPGSEGWTTELPNAGPISWMGPGPVNRVGPDGRRVTLLTADGLPLEPEKIDLPADAAPIEWLRAWTRELTARPSRVPVVKPPSNLRPNRKYYVTGALATSVLLAICVAHGSIFMMQIADARAKADQLAATRTQLAPPDQSGRRTAELVAQTVRLQGMAKDLEGQQSDLQSRLDHETQIANALKTRDIRLGRLELIHRQALAELLAALVDLQKTDNPNNIIVNEIREDFDGSLRLTGLCKESAMADEFATKLERQLSKSVWNIGAAQKQLRADGLAFDFAMALTPAVLTANPDDSALPFAVPSSTAAAGDR